MLTSFVRNESCLVTRATMTPKIFFHEINIKADVLTMSLTATCGINITYFCFDIRKPSQKHIRYIG